MRDDLCGDYRLVDMSDEHMNPLHLEQMSYRLKRFNIQTQRDRGNPKYKHWSKDEN